MNASDELLRRIDAARNPPLVPTRRSSAGPTVREHVTALLDPGTFVEVGTLAHSDRPEEADATPGDGKIGGHGRIAGRPVTVVGDDGRIKRASTAQIASVKVHRLYDQAEAAGNPFIYLGQTGGARIPDCLGSVGHTRLDPMAYLSRRKRRIPLISAIVGESFGGSSLVSALSDFTVQLRGSCLAVTSPLVISQATGSEPSFDEVGGAEVHEKVTGQIDRAADDFTAAAALIRQFLDLLPQNAWSPAPHRGAGQVAELDEGLPALVPDDFRRPYDMGKVVARIADPGSVLEIRPGVGRSIFTAFARIDGHSVGLIASQPMHAAGAITPKGCDKIVRLLCTCDAFGLPVIFLQDTPGFLVGTNVEREGLLFKAMLVHQAIALSSVPILTVIVRKSYGLGTAALAGPGMGADSVWAWPTAQIGFMDPHVGVRIIDRKELDMLEPDERAAEVTRRAAELAEDNSVYGAAGIMRVDEVIEPARTRARLAARLGELAARAPVPLEHRILSTWPTSW